MANDDDVKKCVAVIHKNNHTKACKRYRRIDILYNMLKNPIRYNICTYIRIYNRTHTHIRTDNNTVVSQYIIQLNTRYKGKKKKL